MYYFELLQMFSVLNINTENTCLFTLIRGRFFGVMKIAFRSLQIWTVSGGKYRQEPPKRLGPSALAIMPPTPVIRNLATALIRVGCDALAPKTSKQGFIMQLNLFQHLETDSCLLAFAKVMDVIPSIGYSCNQTCLHTTRYNQFAFY